MFKRYQSKNGYFDQLYDRVYLFIEVYGTSCLECQGAESLSLSFIGVFSKDWTLLRRRTVSRLMDVWIFVGHMSV